MMLKMADFVAFRWIRIPGACYLTWFLGPKIVEFKIWDWCAIFFKDTNYGFERIVLPGWPVRDDVLVQIPVQIVRVCISTLSLTAWIFSLFLTSIHARTHTHTYSYNQNPTQPYT